MEGSSYCPHASSFFLKWASFFSSSVGDEGMYWFGANRRRLHAGLPRDVGLWASVVFVTARSGVRAAPLNVIGGIGQQGREGLRAC